LSNFSSYSNLPHISDRNMVTTGVGKAGKAGKPVLFSDGEAGKALKY